MADAQIRAVITAEDRASKTLQNVTGSFTKMAGAVAVGQGVYDAAKASVTSLVNTFQKSLTAYQTQEVAEARLQAGINNVRSATDKHIDSLLAQASALQKTTRFSDEAVISAQGILSTFQLNQNVIKQLTPRLLDMSEGIARVSGGLPDLEGNASLVAKALGGEDVTGLVGALRRGNVMLTDHQMELLQTGDFQTRLSTITQALDDNFNGMSKAVGDTSAGIKDKFNHQVDEAHEKMGKLISEGLDPVLVKITAWMEKNPTLSAQLVSLISISAALTVGLGALGFAAGGAATALGILTSPITILIGAVTAFGLSLAGLIGKWHEMPPVVRAAAVAITGPIGAITAIVRTLIDAIRAASDGWGNFVNKIENSIKSISGKKSMLNPLGIKIPGFASGVDNFGGGLAVVGERGPELVNLPRGSSVIPNNQINNVSQPTINISLNGIFTGTPQEARKLANMVLDNLKDVANAKNMTLAELMR